VNSDFDLPHAGTRNPTVEIRSPAGVALSAD
jgi:hypothetical protein